MTDDIVEILKNATSIKNIVVRNGSFECVITSNNNGFENEHMVIFDQNGIIVQNNLTGLILKNQKYDFNVISAIIKNFNILIDYEYKEGDFLFDDYGEIFEYDYDYSDYKLNLINLAFRYMSEKAAADFIRICNKKNLIDKINYFLFLEFVCESGNTKIFKYLMSSYLEYFKGLDNYDKSILTGSVCFSGNKELVRILLQNKKFNFGFYALKGAILGKNFDIFEFLIQNNITDINVKNEKGETILFDAIKNNYIYDIIINRPEIIDILIDSCGPNIKGIKPIIAEYLLSWPQLDVNIKNNFEQTILHLAVKYENLEIINFLFKRRPEIIRSLNEKDDYGSTPLHLAAENINAEIIRILLNKPGIEESLNEKDEEDWTPIRYAIQNENPNVTKFLLKKPEIKESLLEIDEDGCTLLHHAVSFDNNLKIIKLLLERPEIKENLNFKNKFGETPLYTAIINGNSNIVKLLLSQENIKLEEKEIKELNKYFLYDKEIINLMNNYITRTKAIAFSSVINILSDKSKQLRK